MEQITYRLDQFEGPLDLLLTLIQKNKIDISDIPISLLCDQYMEYIKAAEESQIEIASEFIVMASELMLIKSRMLLPRSEEEAEDPRAALAAAMLEYQRAKESAQILNARFAEYGLRMTKDTDEITADKTYVAPHDVELLARAYNRVINEIKLTEDTEKTAFTPLIKQQTVSVGDIVSGLKTRLASHKPISLNEYFSEARGKSELIVMFMTMLELLKSELLVLEETEESDDGVISASDGVTVKLKDDADAEDLMKYVSREE